MNYILDDFPQFKDELIEAFNKITKRVSAFPVVLTHGDLNPHNILPKGIIDFGYVFNGYAGYDLVGNIYQIYLFPREGNYESIRPYGFTKKQFDTYFKAMDNIYSGNGYPELSEYQDDFMLAKTIWAAARIIGKPKIQKWRFSLLEKITLDYLDSKPIIETAKKFPS